MAKIKVNDNLVNILNYINTAEVKISYTELLQYVIDYDMYAEFYYNQMIIIKLIDEHNLNILQKEKEKGVKNET